MNSRGIGVCMIGNFDEAPPPEEQLEETVRLVRWLMRQFRIGIGNVIGHREAGAMAGLYYELGQYKSCPGKRLDMDAFRWRL